MLKIWLVLTCLAAVSAGPGNTGDPKVFIYDWNGVSPAWYGKSVFQWSVTTGGYGKQI